MGSYPQRFLDMLLSPLRLLFAAPGRLFASGKRVLGLSVPARIAWLVAVLLTVCVMISFLAFWSSTGRPFPQSKFRAVYLITVLLLVVVIPVIVYHVLRLWLEGEVSPFTDIDKAWNAGLAELENQGIDLQQTPLFLIVGSPDELQNKALFDAARISLGLRDLPAGPAALHWFANAEAIYVALTRVGCLSRLAALGKAAGEAQRARPAAPDAPPKPAARALNQTMVDTGEAAPRDSQLGPPGLVTNLPGGAPWQHGAALGGQENLFGTIMPSEDSLEALRHGGLAEGPRRGEIPLMMLPADEAIQQDRRLEYFAQLLVRHRRPICPANGILTLLPYGLIERDQREAAAVQQAVARDLATLRDALQLRCPATAMVMDMDSDAGFRELVRRVGRERATLSRFGKGFAVSNPPTPERLAALCAHACGAFEDWVYALFRERGALSKPGNARLYALLARMRQHVQPRLENILLAAYSDDPDRGGEPLFFSGCYFAAVGETDDRQAFAKGVLEKLPQEQAELQWTGRARQADRRFQSIAQVIFVLDFLLLAAAVIMLVSRFL